MFWVVILLLVVGGCFYLYKKMTEIEKEIRAGQAIIKKMPSEKIPVQKIAERVDTPPVVTHEVETMVAKTEPVVSHSLSLEDEVHNAVKNLPGVKQSDLYDSFADVSKKRLQQLLKQMADSGKVRREKQGSTYLLFPV